MRKKKVLSREEKMKRLYRQPTDHDWLFVLAGNEDDILRFVSMMLLDPGIVFLLICYVSTWIPNVLLVYLVVDLIILTWWGKRAVKKKKWMEEKKDEDRTEIIMKKIEELKEIEREVREQEVIEEQQKLERQRQKEERKRNRRIRFRKNSSVHSE